MPVPEVDLAPPAVDHVLGGRLAVDVDEDGILLGRVEARRLQAPAVEHDALADLDAEELAPIARQGVQLGPELRVAGQRLHDLVVGQAHQLGDRRPAERGERVDGPPCARRELIGVRPRLVQRGDARRLARSVGRHTEEIALRGVLGRGHEIDDRSRIVDADDMNHVEITAGQPARGALVAGADEFEATPAVAIGGPGEGSPVIEPLQVVVDVDPGLVPVGEHRADLPGPGLREHHLEPVLAAVEPLDHQVVRLRRPFHADDVVLARVAVDLDPPGLAARGRDDPHARGRVLLARLGITHRDDLRIETGGGVEHRVLRHARAVDLPVGDRLAVGTPAEAVAERELFLVHPVEGAVDERVRAVLGERSDRPGGHVLDVQVILPDVGDVLSPGIEGREHQRGFGGLAAELPQHVLVAIEDPVISPRVQPPDLAGVGEEEQLSPVVADGEIGDAERAFAPLGDELSGPDQYLALAGGRIMTNHVSSLATLGILQRQVGRAVLEPVDRGRMLGMELFGAEDPGDGQVRWGIGPGLSPCGEREGQEGRLGPEEEGWPTIRQSGRRARHVETPGGRTVNSLGWRTSTIVRIVRRGHSSVARNRVGTLEELVGSEACR